MAVSRDFEEQIDKISGKIVFYLSFLWQQQLSGICRLIK